MLYNNLSAVKITFKEAIRMMNDGFLYSLQIFIYTLILALPLGLIIYYISISKFKIIRKVTKIFVWIIRGVPLMLQIIAIYYIPPILFKAQLDNKLLIVTIAFVINYACYFSEIYRSGFNGISLGQTEAGLVLGLKKRTIFSKIILLQVIKRTTPPIGNETTTLIKDTALATIIGLPELMYFTNRLTNVYGILWPLIASGIYYLLFVGIITLVFNKIEKKLYFLR